MTKLLKVTCKILDENYWCFDRANDYEANNDNWGCVKDFVGDRYYTSEEEADSMTMKTDKKGIGKTPIPLYLFFCLSGLQCRSNLFFFFDLNRLDTLIANFDLLSLFAF